MDDQDDTLAAVTPRTAKTIGDVQRVLNRVSADLPLGERVRRSVVELFETEPPGLADARSSKAESSSPEETSGQGRLS